jgi:histidinol dehydrogenase
VRVIREKELSTFIKILKQRVSASFEDGKIQDTVRKIIQDVKRQGDRAVKRYTEKFDRIKLTQLSITIEEI